MGSVSNLKCALSVQAHLTHGDQHLLIDELRLSLRLHLLTLHYQLEGTRDEGGCYMSNSHGLSYEHLLHKKKIKE